MYSLKQFSLVVILLSSASLVQGQSIYCPNSETDTDGDGWGWENNTSCVVLDAPANTPVCSNPELDTDGDGWGLEQGQRCLVSNQFVNFPLEGGVLSIPHNGSVPVIEKVRRNPMQYLRSAVRASNGTIYTNLPALNLLAALDPDGQEIWQVPVGNNFIDDIQLDKDENNLYLHMAAGEIASYGVNGNFNWMTPSFYIIYEYKVMSDSIVIRRGGESSENLVDNSIVSIALDGSINWEFTPTGRYMGKFYIDSEENIVVRMDVNDGSELYIFK